MLTLYTKDEEQTKKLGQTISNFLVDGDVVLIAGDLGAGKTIFVKGVAKGLGINENEVSSPSYTYINKYSGLININHVDLYLLNDYDDVYHTGIEEVLGKDLSLIEWGNKFEQLFSDEFWNIRIDYYKESRREIRIRAPKSKRENEKRIEYLWHK